MVNTRIVCIYSMCTQIPSKAVYIIISYLSTIVNLWNDLYSWHSEFSMNTVIIFICISKHLRRFVQLILFKKILTAVNVQSMIYILNIKIIFFFIYFRVYFFVNLWPIYDLRVDCMNIKQLLLQIHCRYTLDN